MLDQSGQYHLENTTLDYQKLSDKEVLRITGPLGADFTIKVRADINIYFYSGDLRPTKPADNSNSW